MLVTSCFRCFRFCFGSMYMLNYLLSVWCLLTSKVTPFAASIQIKSDLISLQKIMFIVQTKKHLLNEICLEKSFHLFFILYNNESMLINDKLIRSHKNKQWIDNNKSLTSKRMSTALYCDASSKSFRECAK